MGRSPARQARGRSALEAAHEVTQDEARGGRVHGRDLGADRLGLACVSMLAITAMASPFAPLTPAMTAFRHSMITTCILAANTVAILFYLHRKAR